jgi:Na+/phosphate symporter
MTARILLFAGLLLFAFDVARLNVTGVALLGVVFIAIAAVLLGALTPSFWIADEPTSVRLDAVDREIGR